MTYITRLDRLYYTNGKVRSPVMADVINGSAEIVLKKRRVPLTAWNKGAHRFVEEEVMGFEGIEIVPYDEAVNLNELGLDDIMWKRPIKELFDKHEWLSAIEDAVELSWDPSKFNLFFHSSGYDSRIISHFLRRSYKRRPGTILFACMEPESVNFKKVMEYQGWDESQWAVYDMFADPFKLIFDFNTAWKGLNGARLFPRSMFDTCIKYLQILEKVPKDMSNVVLWHGYGMNELPLNQEPLGTIIYQMYHQMHPPLLDVMCPISNSPIWSTRSLRAIFSKRRSDAEFSSSPISNYDHSFQPLLKMALLNMLDPKLASIPKTNLYWGTPIPPSEYSRMVRDFKASYYYNHIDNGVLIPKSYGASYDAWPSRSNARKAEYSIRQTFMKAWTFASLVEHLVKRGVKIRKG